MTQSQISIPLDIEDVNVVKVEVISDGAIHITLESSLQYGYCRKCGQKITMLHGHDNWVKVQHLPSFGRAVFLHSDPNATNARNATDGRRQRSNWLGTSGIVRTRQPMTGTCYWP